MKINGILNSDISSTLSYLGHTDFITIADCGLPIPDNTKRIDISLKKGTPSFIETLETISLDMCIEEIILAKEIKEKNVIVLEEIKRIFDESKVKFTFISHKEFKMQTANSKAIIRTGEVTPYANIILISGCVFS